VNDSSRAGHDLVAGGSAEPADPAALGGAGLGRDVALTPYHRTVLATRRPIEGRAGAERIRTQVDDWFHGFALTLDVVGGVVTAARATAHRHPWTTCVGALPSADALVGVEVAQVASTILRQGRATTCVHLNDLAWLAARGHVDRRYDVEVTPHRLTLTCDERLVLDWPLAGWVVSDGPFAGTTSFGAGFASILDDLGADDDLREAVRIARRAAGVGTGYHTLDWPRLARGADVAHTHLADTCHAFTAGVVEHTLRLAAPPPRAGPGPG
jgi:hypothetical protein